MSWHCIYYRGKMHINSTSKSQGAYSQENEKNWGHSSEISKLVIKVMYFK